MFVSNCQSGTAQKNDLKSGIKNLESWRSVFPIFFFLLFSFFPIFFCFFRFFFSPSSSYYYSVSTKYLDDFELSFSLLRPALCGGAESNYTQNVSMASFTSCCGCIRGMAIVSI
jgi:hypothetical protein